jgi:hypothetical protein
LVRRESTIPRAAACLRLPRADETVPDLNMKATQAGRLCRRDKPGHPLSTVFGTGPGSSVHRSAIPFPVLFRRYQADLLIPDSAQGFGPLWAFNHSDRGITPRERRLASLRRWLSVGTLVTRVTCLVIGSRMPVVPSLAHEAWPTIAPPVRWACREERR